MRKSNIKVMVGTNGVARIQEDTGDSVKVYTSEEWKKIQEERVNLVGDSVEEKVTPTKSEDTEEGLGIEEDTEDETETASAEMPTEIKSEPVKGKRGKPKKA